MREIKMTKNIGLQSGMKEHRSPLVLFAPAPLSVRSDRGFVVCGLTRRFITARAMSWFVLLPVLYEKVPSGFHLFEVVILTSSLLLKPGLRLE